MLFTYIVYNTILLFVLWFGYLVKISSTRHAEYFYRTIVFLSIVIPASIRKGIGTDYWAYVGLYDWYRTNSDEHEIVFQLLGKLMSTFGFSHQMFIAVLAILAFAPICYYVPKRKFYPFIVFYFFLLFPSCMSTSRQAIAVSLITCGLFALYKERGRLKYTLCAIIAFLIHFSSDLYFPLLFLKNIRLSVTKVYLFLGVILLAVSGTGLIDHLFSHPLFMDSTYGVYAENVYNREASVGTGLGIIANLIIPFLFLLLNRKISAGYSHVAFFAILDMLYIGSYLLAAKIHIFGRLMGCFAFVPAFLVDPVCKTLAPKYQKLILFLFFLIYLILYEKTITDSQVYLGSGLGISPYTTIFD